MQHTENRVCPEENATTFFFGSEKQDLKGFAHKNK
jgi:hypothetical protein